MASRALFVGLLAITLAVPALGRTLAQAPGPAPAPLGSTRTWSETQKNTGWTDVDAKTAYDIWKKGGAFIDVRTKGEFEAAHLNGSYNIETNYRDPVTKEYTKKNPNFVAEVKAVVPDLNTPVILTCWGGGASRTASQLLLAAGYKNVYNNYFGFQSSGWSTTVNEPNGYWGDTKSQNYPEVVGTLIPANITGVKDLLANELGLFPGGLPTNVTLFLPSDDYIRYVARTLGFPSYTNQTFPDFIDWFKNNETALGLLRYVLVNGIVPYAPLTQNDLKTIGLAGIETAIPGQLLKFNSTGTRVVTPGYAKTNIIGKIDGHPSGYVVDWALVPDTKDLKPLTKEEAQKLVAAALAKAGKGLPAAKSPAAAPATAPSASAGRR